MPHAVCRFGAGGHLFIVSHGTTGQSNFGGTVSKFHRAPAGSVGIVEMRSVRRFLKHGVSSDFDAFLEAAESFPGPLCCDSSDKTALIEFCRRKIDTCRKDVLGADQQSVALIWQTISTLIRQNGVRNSMLSIILVYTLDFIYSRT